MLNLERRSDDRRIKIERRKTTTSMINDFVGQYGPEPRICDSRRDISQRRH